MTAHAITEKYLARIEAIDKHGPAINSVIEVNPDALSIAKELDRERKQKHIRGPLHGIPVLIKDNIDTSDRMMTTAGSLALVGSKPPKDSMVAQKLREAGAVILGKTNLSEWANIRSNQSSQRLERARRADKKSLRAGSQSLRVEFGLGRGSVGEFVRYRDWNGNGRLDCVPGVGEWRRGLEADGGPGEPERDHSDFA